MSNFIGKREEELGETCDRLQDWIEKHLGSETEFYVELSLTQYTSAILVGEILVWDSENSPCDPTFENCRDVFKERMQELAKLMSE
jgi:hypothetical protein